MARQHLVVHCLVSWSQLLGQSQLRQAEPDHFLRCQQHTGAPREASLCSLRAGPRQQLTVQQLTEATRRAAHTMPRNVLVASTLPQRAGGEHGHRYLVHSRVGHVYPWRTRRRTASCECFKPEQKPRDERKRQAKEGSAKQKHVDVTPGCWLLCEPKSRFAHECMAIRAAAWLWHHARR